MIDIIEYVNNKVEYTQDSEFKLNLTKFLVSNNWFGETPNVVDDKVFVSDKFIERASKKIDEFCKNYNASAKDKVHILTDKIRESMPKTANLLQKYAEHYKLEEETIYQLSDFILYSLPGEINEATDSEIADILNDAFDNLPKAYGDILTDFINWVHSKTRTIYQCTYFMEKYYESDEESSAYDQHSYLSILFRLYNQDYIEENDMYYQAAISKNYIDTWLFLALHFLCALRNTDIVRIPHPILQNSPEEVLENIKENKFSDEEARQTLYSVVWHLNAIMLTPNKTSDKSGIASIKIHIPESVEVHMGKLFAIAEAHFLLSDKDEGEPLIRVISSYEQINRYMGEEIGELFLHSNFKSRSANKSYMQMIFLLTDDILEIDEEFSVKGYTLAALARSHKGSYGDFAKTTSIYLKDAKMNGFTPEFVAKEMFERGVLSLIPSMLLKMINGDKYTDLSVENQTEAIKALNLSPFEIEKMVGLMQVNMKRSYDIVKAIYGQYTKEQIITILHRIGNGEAVSKCDECLCLITALGKMCPYKERHNCPSCEYEISTKTTMFLMVEEVKRLQALYANSNNELEKNKYKAIVRDVVAPSIDEMLKIIEEQYGPSGIESLEKIISGVY